MFGTISVYQRDLSPLSARSVIEVCVMPVLMYGSERWHPTAIQHQIPIEAKPESVNCNTQEQTFPSQGS